MKTTELYLKVLNKVRFEIMAEKPKIDVFEESTEVTKEDYIQLLNSFNKAANLITDLINIMEYDN